MSSANHMRKTKREAPRRAQGVKKAVAGRSAVIEIKSATARAVKGRYPDCRSWDERIARLLEDAEDAADIAAAKRVLEHERLEDGLPMALAKRLLDGENPVRIWREHRGLKAIELARKAGIAQGYLSEIERAKKQPSARALKALGKALDVPIDDLVQPA